jgi:hypothetical protein
MRHSLIGAFSVAVGVVLPLALSGTGCAGRALEPGSTGLGPGLGDIDGGVSIDSGLQPDVVESFDSSPPRDLSVPPPAPDVASTQPPFDASAPPTPPEPMQLPARAPDATYPAGSQPVALAVGDFNNDGHLDVVVIDDNIYNPSNLLLGTGRGDFQPAKPLPGGIAATDVAAVALRPGGPLDLVLATNPDNGDEPGHLVVLFGHGDGTFSVENDITTPSLELSAVTTADLDLDRQLDVLVAGNGTDRQLHTYRTTTPGHFELLQSVVLGGLPQRPGSIGVGRLSDSGFANPDVVVATEEHGTFLLPAVGDGRLGSPQVLPALADNSSSVAVADLDGDGKDDLVVVSQQYGLVQMLLSRGTPGSVLNAPVQSFRVDAADYVTVLPDRGRGRRVMVCGEAGLVNVLHVGRTGNVVQGPALPLQGSMLTQCGAGDFNEDGRLDLLVPNFTEVTVFLDALEGL